MRMSPMGCWQRVAMASLALAVATLGPGLSEPAMAAEAKAEKMFDATLTDTQNVETSVKNLVFYWEEKVSDTAFVPHDVRYLPVKRGSATVHVKFDTMKQIEVKAGASGSPPTVTVTLANGKTGEFVLAIVGSFRGESDFGAVDVPAAGVSKVVLK